MTNSHSENEDKIWLERIRAISQVFSPSAPIEQHDLFFGRINQLSDILDVIDEKGQHCVLYGERGVGKTSLANIIHTNADHFSLCVKVTCNRSDSFKGIWTKALSKITFWKKQQEIGFGAKINKTPQQLDLFMPQGTDITSADLENIFEFLDDKVLIIFDEFDSIIDPKIKEQFADCLKSFSDNVSKITILLVGIGETVNELVGEHQSLERCLKQVQLPRMSKEELGEIIDFGFKEIGIRIEHGVRKKIIEFSSGFPHYTHLLSKFVAQIAVNQKAKMAAHEHFDEAVKIAITNSQQQIRGDYQKAIISSKETAHFENVLFALAHCNVDDYDSSTANEIVSKFNEITGLSFSRESLTYHLGVLCKAERGEVLLKVGTSKNIKYKFRSPLFKNFVKLNYYKKVNEKYFS